MRIRSVKPEFWTDEITGLMAAEPALLFVGLWSFADDDGRFRWDPVLLRAQIDPYDAKFGGPEKIARLLESMVTLGRVIRYEANGRPYGAIPSFAEHQHPDKKKQSKLPNPPPSGQAANPPRPVPDASPTNQGKVGLGREGKGEGREGLSSPPPTPGIDAFVDALRGRFAADHGLTADILRGNDALVAEVACEVARFPDPSFAANALADEVKARRLAGKVKRIPCNFGFLIHVLREIPSAQPKPHIKVLA